MVRLPKKVAEQTDGSTEIPFWTQLENLAEQFPFGGDWKSRGGGTQSLWSADGSLPAQFAKHSIAAFQNISLPDIVDNDLLLLQRGLRKAKAGKTAPRWSVPKEVWQYLLVSTKEHQASSVLLACIWFMLYAVRVAGFLPIAWQMSMGILLPKFNGKWACLAFRLIHLLDTIGKGWLGEIWENKTRTDSRLELRLST